MSKITPFFWFEKDMKAITDFYMSVFPGSKIKGEVDLEGTPSGPVQTLTFEIFGQEFNFMTAGPYKTFNPTVSFIISCDSLEEVDTLWNKLSETGKVLMELNAYPFAEKYGWVQDQYGVSWQIMFSTENKGPQKVIPTLMFAGDVCGRAEEAVNFYTSIFHNSKIGYVMPYEGNEAVDDERAKTMHAGIMIENFNMSLMDSGKKSPLSFDQSISFVVNCETQEEVDYYWGKLTDGGQEVQCGWLTDKFGFPWQVVPTALTRLLSDPTKSGKVMQAMMPMKKLIIADLEKAAE